MHAVRVLYVGTLCCDCCLQHCDCYCHQLLPTATNYMILRPTGEAQRPLDLQDKLGVHCEFSPQGQHSPTNTSPPLMRWQPLTFINRTNSRSVIGRESVTTDPTMDCCYTGPCGHVQWYCFGGNKLCCCLNGQ